MVRWQLAHADRITAYLRYQKLTGKESDEVANSPRANALTLRILGLYGQLKLLSSLNIGPAILQAEQAMPDDLEWLTVIETEIRRYNNEQVTPCPQT